MLADNVSLNIPNMQLAIRNEHFGCNGNRDVSRCRVAFCHYHFAEIGEHVVTRFRLIQ